MKLTRPRSTVAVFALSSAGPADAGRSAQAGQTAQRAADPSVLRAGGDPTYVWDWYRSNGCLFGSDRATMMAGWDPTPYVNGPGHHTFVLENGDIDASPPAGPRFPLMLHAVPEGTPYAWENRYWYTGSFAWWGDTSYRRANVPGPTSDTGWSLKYFE